MSKVDQTDFNDHNFNFVESIYNSLDLDTLRGMANEMIDLYGYPCVYTRYTGPDMANHPLYKDRLTSTYNVDKFTSNYETRILLDNKHFVPQLMGFGYALNTETTVTAFMKFGETPKVEDLVTLLFNYEAQKYTFQINSVSNWKNIVWNMTLSVYIQDSMKNVETSDPTPLPIMPDKPTTKPSAESIQTHKNRVRKRI